MRARMRAALGVTLALGAGLATASLSRVPYDATRGDDAMLRLSWRARGVAVHECRRLSHEELAQLPPHMRREEVCEGRVLPYLLRVELDGREVVHDGIHGAGAREDRPLYVFREIPVRPGAHRVSVHFDREDDREREHRREDEHPRDPGGSERGEKRSRTATPARLELDTAVVLGPGQVGLVTYDQDARTLLLRASKGAGR